MPAGQNTVEDLHHVDRRGQQQQIDQQADAGDEQKSGQASAQCLDGRIAFGHESPEGERCGRAFCNL
jgi:hypothetical protein